MQVSGSITVKKDISSRFIDCIITFEDDIILGSIYLDSMERGSYRLSYEDINPSNSNNFSYNESTRDLNIILKDTTIYINNKVIISDVLISIRNAEVLKSYLKDIGFNII